MTLGDSEHANGAVGSPESWQRRWAHSRRIPPLSCCSSPIRAGEWLQAHLFLDGFCPAGKTAKLEGSAGAEASSPPLGLCRVPGGRSPGPVSPWSSPAWLLSLRATMAPGVSGPLVPRGSVFIPLGDVGEGLPPSWPAGSSSGPKSPALLPPCCWQWLLRGTEEASGAISCLCVCQCPRPPGRAGGKGAAVRWRCCPSAPPLALGPGVWSGRAESLPGTPLLL